MSNAIHGVGNVTIEGNTVVKTIKQTTKGSAYMKIPGMITTIRQAGYTRVVLRINHDHPYMHRIEDQVSLMRQVVPTIIIEKF